MWQVNQPGGGQVPRDSPVLSQREPSVWEAGVAAGPCGSQEAGPLGRRPCLLR